jgi:hypothetical protein
MAANKVYVHVAVPAAVARLGNKHWLVVDVGNAGGDSEATPGQTNADPSQSLSALRSVRSATVVDTETIDGVAVKHIRAEVDLSALSPAFNQPGTIPMDIWVDRAGRMRRLMFSVDYSKMSLPGVNSLPAGMTQIDMTFSDFGVPINVVVPGAADSLSLTDAEAVLSR